MARVMRAAAVAAALTMLLTGCFGPSGPQPDTAIPDALLASDIGIVDAYANESADGFAKNLFVGVQFDHEDVTSRDLAQVLQIIVDNSDPSRYNYLDVVGRFGGDAATGDLVDLASLSEELGFVDEGNRDGWFHQPISRVSSTIGSD